MARDKKDTAATIAALLLLAVGLWIAFGELAEWAAGAFARPAMGAALVAVIELGLLVLALALAPSFSRLVRLAFGRAAPTKSAPADTAATD